LGQKGLAEEVIQPLAPSVSLIPDDRTMSNDQQLVKAYLARRDDDSFLALYRAHTPALYRTAWRMGGVPAAEIEDVVQETWLRAARGLDRFRFQSALRTWLTGVLIHCLQESRRRHASAGNPDDPREHDELEARRSTPHLQIDLERAVASLPAGMRDVFVLHDVEGLTHDEVARVLGITAGTSKSQLFDARRKLREALTAGPKTIPFRKAHHD
jgi:RNA polymerase sigma-70 factor (ECF subfamily)